jgi:acetyl esterase/lipase
MGSRADTRARQRDLYLRAGYQVVAIDYRLAPETKLPEIVEDLGDACRWVRVTGPRLFGADERRMAVVGHSAGGYLALMAGLLVRPRPSALVSFYGYGDIAGEWYSRPDPFYCRQPMVTAAEAYASVGDDVICEAAGETERGRFYLYCRQQGLWPREVVGCDPDTEPEAFERFCPVRNVTDDYPPTQLLHGSDDTDVPCEQSVMMAKALAEAGIQHELITIPGGEHGFDAADDEVVERVLDRVLAFLKAHV